MITKADMTTLWWISQAFALVTLILAFITFQLKSKKKLLFTLAFVNLFCGIATAFLSNWVAFAMFAVATVRSFLFCFFEYKEEQGKKVNNKIRISCLLLFMVAAIVSVSLTWVWWFDWLMLASFLVSIYGNYKNGTHFIKIALLANNALRIVNDVKFSNLVSLITCCVIIFSVLFFYTKLLIKKSRGTKPPPQPIDNNSSSVL